MDWYSVTGKYHEKTFAHDCQLSSLPEEWQRELAALWRLEADVNNGAYLQFLANWGRESYVYSSQALKKIGARRMAEIVDRCQALVDEHFIGERKSHEESRGLLPNSVTGKDGALLKGIASVLPHAIVERINALSCEFMAYPDDVASLGMHYFRSKVQADDAG